MDRTTGAVQYEVSEDAITLVGEERTVKTEDAEVSEGVVVTTPPPSTKTERECGATFRTIGTEVGWRKKNRLIGGTGKINVRQQQNL